ncbi:hypothetical protein EVA_16588 [gut metagenome]|uniref:Uncharacterized protein n=1 Tax=gut metagenome TaxID=749906 RepID=J9G723_9ZZZZ
MTTALSSGVLVVAAVTKGWGRIATAFGSLASTAATSVASLLNSSFTSARPFCWMRYWVTYSASSPCR